MRVGNGAYDQRQNDVFGAVLDSLYLHTKEYGHNSRAPVAGDRRPGRAARSRIWRAARPGHLGGARRAAALRRARSSCAGSRWTAARAWPRAAASDDLADHWRVVANEIHAEICERGVDERGVLHPALRHRRARRLAACSSRSCASCPTTTTRVRATVLAIADELTENGLVLRYRVDETDDGLQRRGGHVPDLLVLAGQRPAGDRRAQARPPALRAPAVARLAARPLRRGARRRHRPPPRQLPAGLHPPGAHQRGHARHPRRAAAGGVAVRFLCGGAQRGSLASTWAAVTEEGVSRRARCGPDSSRMRDKSGPELRVGDESDPTAHFVRRAFASSLKARTTPAHRQRPS